MVFYSWWRGLGGATAPPLSVLIEALSAECEKIRKQECRLERCVSLVKAIAHFFAMFIFLQRDGLIFLGQ